MRIFIFWLHLIVGSVAGVVILIMSATGVLLTYERQIVEWADARYTVSDSKSSNRLSTDELLNIVRTKHPEEHHFFLRWVNTKGAAVPVWAGNHAYLIDRYTGTILRQGPGKLAEFFRTVTLIHRWFSLEGKNRKIAKSITAYSNLLFVFLILSGLYLWFPRRLSTSLFKRHIFLNTKPKNAKARDFNWHHVFGFWAMLPLFVISITATIFHFTWANSALYGVYGEEVPTRTEHPELDRLIDGKQSYESLFSKAIDHADQNGGTDWYSMWMEVGEVEGEVRFFIDRSIGRRPSLAYSLYLDINSGEVLRSKKQSDWSKGDQAWDIVRYLHTGEVFGFIGQTIAGLASLAACLLVYTGLALSWRRLIAHVIRKKK